MADPKYVDFKPRWMRERTDADSILYEWPLTGPKDGYSDEEVPSATVLPPKQEVPGKEPNDSPDSLPVNE
jgi:hypothetical protein